MGDIGTGETKVPYEPTLKRRFELSQDPFTQERVKALLRAHRELKRDVPFFAGMTAFGSLTKGKVLDAESAKATDVDLFLFVDVDKYESMIDGFINRPDITELYKSVFEHRREGSNVSDHERQSRIELVVNTYLSRKVSGIMNDSIIPDRRPSSLVHLDGAFEFISADSEEPFSIFSWVEDDFGGPPASPLEDNIVIAGPLLFDIGGGMRPYREAFMKKMLTLPKDKQDEYWKLTVNAMRIWEREGKNPPELADWYPDNFQDAVKIYKPQVGKGQFPEIME